MRLWKRDNETVVEVQRTSGCSFLFHQTAKAVLRAAKGLSAVSTKPRLAIPDCIPKETEQERKDCLAEGLDIAASLLREDAIDAHVMAIESLVHLTRVCKCHGYAAQKILSNADLLSTLLSLIETSSMSGNSSQTSLSEVEEEHISLMRRHALNVLSTSLCSLKQHGKLQEILHEQETLLSDSLVAALVDFVSNADEQPHEACQAIRCLQTLTEASSSCRRRALEMGVDAAVSHAQQEGLCRHAQLEDCSHKLRLSMNAGGL